MQVIDEDQPDGAAGSTACAAPLRDWRCAGTLVLLRRN
jgi:hypothetical protein